MFNGISDDGKVLGVTVLDVKELPAEKSVIVLLDYMEMGEGPTRNLAKLREQGELVWIADLPEGGTRECYVSMDLAGDGAIFANTWNGYRVTIDGKTGKVLGKKFTK
jgi:outer membrane protein assembly factor BamB